jgi:hypothetical protein
MAVDIKVAPDEKLELVQTYITDTNPNSDYFVITELPDTFSGGKNAFLIAGSDKLLSNTEIKIQIRDANGKVCYVEYSNGNPEYYEGNSKVVAVYVYPTLTAFGPATITVLGQLKDVPQEWNGLYSVKWERQININPALANTTRVRFYKRPQVQIKELLQPLYSIVSGSKIASLVTQSFAAITVNQLETFAGDVKRVKVFRTSAGDISDYELIQDISVEAKNLLSTYALSGSVVGNAGIFGPDSLSKVWNTGSLHAVLDSTWINDGLQLTGSGTLTYTSSLNLLSSNTYELELDTFYTGSTVTNLVAYISGTQNGALPITTFSGSTPTKNFGTTTIPFTILNDEPTASLYLSQSSGTNQWHVGNISLNLSQDTAFSPNEVSFITSMPTVLGNETFNFKFEFYDVNNNYVPVAVTASALFNGGNNNVGGTLILISGSTSASNASILALSQSVSGTIGTVTGSISQSFYTSSVYSASLQSSSLYISSSISGTISFVSSSLSSSISSSTSLALSKSVATVQSLADGGYSGSFISGGVIYAPVIGGQQGYISQLFTVGSTAAATINLDARTTTRKIWIGSGVNGTYNSNDTPIYLDSSGKFSLGNKLNWDGSTLNVTGIINITSGPTYDSIAAAQSAATSAKSTADTAKSTADTAKSTADTAINSIFTDTAGLINKAATPTGAGLYLGSSYLGYYNGGAWTSYLNNSGNFYLNGSDGHSGLSWIPASNALSIDGNITARNGTFYGSITSNATITGGTISGGTLIGATGTFSGNISAAGGNIGNWQIIGGNLVDSNNKMILNPSTPSLTLNNDSGIAKTTIRTGPLSVIADSVEFTIPSLHVTSPSTYAQGESVDSEKVYYQIATSLGQLESGLYNGVFDYNYIGNGTIVRVDAYTNGTALYYHGFDILDSSDNVINSYEFGRGLVSNYSANPNYTYTNLGVGTGHKSLTIPSSQEYFVRPWYNYKLNSDPGAGAAFVYALNFILPSILMQKVQGYAEFTDQGLQIVSNTYNYIKMEVGGQYDFKSEGTWYHTNGDIRLVESQGALFAQGSHVLTTAGSPSDERLKENIISYTNGLSHIKQFNPKWYKFKKRFNEKNLAGLIAQEVESVDSNYVTENAEGHKELNYPAIYMSMLNAIKDLAEKVEKLESQLSGSK